MVHKAWDQSDVISRYTEMRPEMTRFVELLDAELRR
jgi:hypothetical protein